jgi:hypothetical protein
MSDLKLPPIENEHQLNNVQTLIDMMIDYLLVDEDDPDDQHSKIILNAVGDLVRDYEQCTAILGKNDG